MHTVVIRKRLWFTYQDVYIDDNTRISYGFHLAELDCSYWLERKIKGKWKRTAWTYFGGTVEGVLRYLLYREKRYASKNIKKAFDNAE